MPSSAGVTAGGYLKDLWRYSHSALEDRPYFLNIARARATVDAGAAVFKAHVDYDHEVLSGSWLRTRDHRLFGLGEPPAWLRLEQALSSGDTSRWRHRLHRGWAGLETDDAALRFGRQRVAWGTGKLWNPTDILNPYQPTSLERDERRGVDAAYWRQGLGSLTQAELVYAPQDRWPQSALLGRARSNWSAFDVSLLGGKTAASTGSWVVGGDFAGDLGGGSLHGEWSYTDPRTRAPYWKGLLGYEYTFSSEPSVGWLRDAYVVVDYLHSGSGAADPSRYDLGAVLSGREVTLARHYAGLLFTKDLHPLLKLELAALANLDDRSHFLAPSLQWNALKDLYLSAGMHRTGGSRLTEFGRSPNTAFLQAQWYF